jgi:hypothetical protein
MYCRGNPNTRQYHKDNDEFLNHIVRVTDDETFHLWTLKHWSSQSTGCTHSPNKLKKFKRMLSACQKADGNCFLGQERIADGGIHATRDHINVRGVLRNTNKNCVGPFRKKARNMDIRCSAPPWQWVSAHLCIFSHSSTAGAFQLGVVWPVFTALISLQATTTYLPTWSTGWDHSVSTAMKSWWKESKCG